MSEPTFKPGEYAVLTRSNFVVRLSDHPNANYFGVEFVDGRPGRPEIGCGGYASATSAELAPISSAADLLLVRAYEAKRLIALAEEQIKIQRKIVEASTAGLRALQDAEATIRASTEAATNEGRE